MAASYCQCRSAQGCCTAAVLGCQQGVQCGLAGLLSQPLWGLCGSTWRHDIPCAMIYSVQKLCQLAHRGEGKDARCLAVASSHF